MQHAGYVYNNNSFIMNIDVIGVLMYQKRDNNIMLLIFVALIIESIPLFI